MGRDLPSPRQEGANAWRGSTPSDGGPVLVLFQAQLVVFRHCPREPEEPWSLCGAKFAGAQLVGFLLADLADGQDGISRHAGYIFHACGYVCFCNCLWEHFCFHLHELLPECRSPALKASSGCICSGEVLARRASKTEHSLHGGTPPGQLSRPLR